MFYASKAYDILRNLNEKKISENITGRLKEGWYPKSPLKQFMSVPTTDKDMSFPLQHGIKLEPLSKLFIEKAHGVKIRDTKKFIHDIFVCQPDGEFTDKEGRTGIVEIKSPWSISAYKSEQDISMLYKYQMLIYARDQNIPILFGQVIWKRENDINKVDGYFADGVAYLGKPDEDIDNIEMYRVDDYFIIEGLAHDLFFKLGDQETYRNGVERYRRAVERMFPDVQDPFTPAQKFDSGNIVPVDKPDRVIPIAFPAKEIPNDDPIGTMSRMVDLRKVDWFEDAAPVKISAVIPAPAPAPVVTPTLAPAPTPVALPKSIIVNGVGETKIVYLKIREPAPIINLPDIPIDVPEPIARFNFIVPTIFGSK